MSGRKDFDKMSPEQIAEWAARDWAEAKERHAEDPLPEFSRVKRDDYPHWDVVAYEFHTSPGDRVLVGRDGHEQAEGTLGGVRTARGQDELLVELDGTVWACVRADGEQWSPKDNGRVRVDSLTVAVVARRDDGTSDAEEWTVQTNMKGQP